MGNKLPLDTYSAMPARRLHTDYTGLTRILFIKWNVICFNDAKLRWKNEIGNCSKTGASRTGSVSHTGRLISKLENERISKWGGLSSSEENGDFQKEVEGSFGEKRV